MQVLIFDYSLILFSISNRLQEKSLSYKAFLVKGNPQEEDAICILLRVRVSTLEINGSTFLCVEFVGNRFLRHMVRSLVV